jgi:hypothetical protein
MLFQTQIRLCSLPFHLLLLQIQAGLECSHTLPVRGTEALQFKKKDDSRLVQLATAP